MTAAVRVVLASFALAACNASANVDGTEQEAERCVLSDLPRTRLRSPTPLAGALFGTSIAIDGDVLVVSAVEETHNFSRGAVYVFERSGSDWLPTAAFHPSDFGSSFGDSIAVKGDTILVGDGTEWDVFHRSATGWERAGNFRQNVGFDGHIALTDDRLIVGATGEDINVLFGYAFVYPRSGTTLGTAIPIDVGLPNECESPCPMFGEAVVAEGDLVAVSAPGRGYGEVHVFRGGDPTTLVHEATLDRPADARAMQTPFGFGEQLALDGERIFVGDSFARDGEGAVTVYANNNGSWELEAHLRGEGDSLQSFSLGLAAADHRLLVGAPFVGGFDNGDPDGAVRLYTRDAADAWTETAVLLDEMPGSTFGWAIAATPELVAIGAPHGSGRAGDVYLYDMNDVESHCVRDRERAGR